MSEVDMPEDKVAHTSPKPDLRKRKVALIGTASTSVNDAPFGDTSFEIWGLAWRVLPRVTRMFDMHPMVNRKNTPANYIELLGEVDKPIYLQKLHPRIPTSVRYPIEEVIDFFGPASMGKSARGEYFVSSFAYMAALAIYEGFEEIHSYGFDMLEDSEYGYQRPNAEYFVGLARGRGITFYLPEGCAMCRYPYLYGYEEWEAGVHQAFSKKDIEKRMKTLQAEKEKKLAELHHVSGMCEEAKQWQFLMSQIKKGGQYHKV